jgi:hypothetical protein
MGYDEPWSEAIEARQGTLEPLAPNVWWVWSLMKSPPLPRNMVVVRLPSGELLVHSAVCLPEAQMAKLDAWGPVAWVVVPNEGHRSDLRRWRARYPNAKVLAPRAAVPKVQEVGKVDASCEDVLPGLGITCHTPDGMKPGYELVYEVPLEGGGVGLVVNDVLAAPHPATPGGFQGFLMGLLGTPGATFGQPRIVRFFFGKDRPAFKGFVARLAETKDLRLLTSSHGPPLTGDVAGALRAAAASL